MKDFAEQYRDANALAWKYIEAKGPDGQNPENGRGTTTRS